MIISSRDYKNQYFVYINNTHQNNPILNQKNKIKNINNRSKNIFLKTQEILKNTQKINNFKEKIHTEPIIPIQIHKKNTSFDKIIVVEVFSSFLNKSLNSEIVENELIGNIEAGLNLAKHYHQNKRYIWSINPNMTNKIIEYSKRYGNDNEIINLADEKDPILNLTVNSKLIIVAQGNLKKSQIADLESDAFIELLQEDLEITKLAELELIVCKMGKDREYIRSIKKYFNENDTKTNIISYNVIITASKFGEIIGFNRKALIIDQIDTVKNLD